MVSSQPFFLYMICFGSLVVASVIIPCTLDDEGGSHSQRGLDIACMSVPWLYVLGFIIIYSALFSKTWRINKIFKGARSFERVTVKPRDVLIPFIVLMISSLTLLSVWTALDPLVYKRQPTGQDTDEWNRIVSTYGSCISVPRASSAAEVCGWLLFGMLFLALIATCVQANQARSVSSDYSESTYIGFAVVLILQLHILAAPIIAFNYTSRIAVYYAEILVCFLTSSMVLLLIFVPKLLLLRSKLQSQIVILTAQ
jgi:gamma-aminobutyric acid type B receptor